MEFGCFDETSGTATAILVPLRLEQLPAGWRCDGPSSIVDFGGDVPPALASASAPADVDKDLVAACGSGNASAHLVLRAGPLDR
jgi:hypothetical protein